MTKLLDREFDYAARAAADAVEESMTEYAEGEITDEDDITPWVAKAIKLALNGQVDGLLWRSTVVRHRKGIAAEESKSGADLLIYYSLHTKRLTMSKGVIVQAKRSEPMDFLPTAESVRLVSQCKKMLNITPASFVWNYSKSGMRCGSAHRTAGLRNHNLHNDLELTPYGFFDLFLKCPLGDQRITSSSFADLQIPNVLELRATDDG